MHGNAQLCGHCLSDAYTVKFAHPENLLGAKIWDITLIQVELCPIIFSNTQISLPWQQTANVTIKLASFVQEFEVCPKQVEL